MFGKRWAEADINSEVRPGGGEAPYSALFGLRHGAGGPSFRQLALIKDGGPDDRKYALGPDPLGLEDRMSRMQAGPPHKRKQLVEGAFKKLIQRTEAEGGLGSAKLQHYGKVQAEKDLAEKEREIDQEFISDFVDWVRGGKDPRTQEEHRIAGWNPNTIHGPVSDHPSVKKFLDQHFERRLNYMKKLAEMKMRAGRLSADSRTGQGATLDDLFKYYKYYVRNLPFEDEGDIDVGGDGMPNEDRARAQAADAGFPQRDVRPEVDPGDPARAPQPAAPVAAPIVPPVANPVDAAPVPPVLKPPAAPTQPTQAIQQNAEALAVATDTPTVTPPPPAAKPPAIKLLPIVRETPKNPSAPLLPAKPPPKPAPPSEPLRLPTRPPSPPPPPAPVAVASSSVAPPKRNEDDDHEKYKRKLKERKEKLRVAKATIEALQSRPAPPVAPSRAEDELRERLRKVEQEKKEADERHDLSLARIHRERKTEAEALEKQKEEVTQQRLTREREIQELYKAEFKEHEEAKAKSLKELDEKHAKEKEQQEQENKRLRKALKKEQKKLLKGMQKATLEEQGKLVAQSRELGKEHEKKLKERDDEHARAREKAKAEFEARQVLREKELKEASEARANVERVAFEERLKALAEVARKAEEKSIESEKKLEEERKATQEARELAFKAEAEEMKRSLESQAKALQEERVRQKAEIDESTSRTKTLSDLALQGHEEAYKAGVAAAHSIQQLEIKNRDNAIASLTDTVKSLREQLSNAEVSVQSQAEARAKQLHEQTRQAAVAAGAAELIRKESETRTRLEEEARKHKEQLAESYSKGTEQYAKRIQDEAAAQIAESKQNAERRVENQLKINQEEQDRLKKAIETLQQALQRAQEEKAKKPPKRPVPVTTQEEREEHHVKKMLKDNTVELLKEELVARQKERETLVQTVRDLHEQERKRIEAETAEKKKSEMVLLEERKKVLESDFQKGQIERELKQQVLKNSQLEASLTQLQAQLRAMEVRAAQVAAPQPPPERPPSILQKTHAAEVPIKPPQSPVPKLSLEKIPAPPLPQTPVTSPRGPAVKRTAPPIAPTSPGTAEQRRAFYAQKEAAQELARQANEGSRQFSPAERRVLHSNTQLANDIYRNPDAPLSEIMGRFSPPPSTKYPKRSEVPNIVENLPKPTPMEVTSSTERVTSPPRETAGVKRTKAKAPEVELQGVSPDIRKLAMQVGQDVGKRESFEQLHKTLKTLAAQTEFELAAEAAQGIIRQTVFDFVGLFKFLRKHHSDALESMSEDELRTYRKASGLLRQARNAGAQKKARSEQ